MVEDTLPTGWQEVEDTNQDAGRYDPQPISRFEHAETGAGIRLTPADTNARGGSEAGDDGDGEYRIAVAENGPDDPSDMTAIDDASSHADALGVAREFMDAYNERCIDGEEGLDSLRSEYDEPGSIE